MTEQQVRDFLAQFDQAREDFKNWPKWMQDAAVERAAAFPKPPVSGVKGRVTLTPDGEAMVPGVGAEFAMQCLARADALLQGIADRDVVVHSAAHELHHALQVLRRAHGVGAAPSPKPDPEARHTTQCKHWDNNCGAVHPSNCPDCPFRTAGVAPSQAPSQALTVAELAQRSGVKAWHVMRRIKEWGGGDVTLNQPINLIGLATAALSHGVAIPQPGQEKLDGNS